MPAVGDALGDTCHIIGRKKRRGLIEKRRRDRINNSLNELRRLVPAAFEKQGSAKLEKAEILQMTVDHLTMLHAKGFDAFSFDPHKFAMDYHGIGFRECMSEVIRYLGTVEGLDSQDPLRLRTLSHLQCYASQREMALKSSAAVSSWNPAAFTTPMHQFSVPTVAPSSSITASQQSVHHHLNSQSMSHNDLLVSSSSSSSSSSSNATWPGHSINNSSPGDHMLMPPAATQMSSEHLMPPPPPLFKTSTSPVGSPVSCTGSSTASSASLPHHSYCYTMAPTAAAAAAAAQYFPSAAGYPHHPATSSTSSAVGQQASVKCYRPWGAELAY